MKTYALVDASGVVRNTITWDGVAEYTPPAGLTVIDTTGKTMPCLPVTTALTGRVDRNGFPLPDVPTSRYVWNGTQFIYQTP